MTITLKLSPEQEHLLQTGVAEQDAQTVREVLLQAVDSTIEGLLRSSAQLTREPFAALRALAGTAHSDFTDISTDKYAHVAAALPDSND